MAKTKEESNEIKENETIDMKYHELSDEELAQVLGGVGPEIYRELGDDWDKKDVEIMFTGEQGNENFNTNQSPSLTNEQFKDKTIDIKHF